MVTMVNLTRLVVCALLIAFNDAASLTCTSDSECASNECCQILSEFMIVSRRDLPQLATKAPLTGTCHPYRNEGDHCDVFAKPNGYCSCAPGLSCVGKEIPLLQPVPIGKRDMRPSRPGYTWEYKCTKV